MNNIHFSSNSDEWETPQWLFDKLDSIFNFEYDICASDENSKCKKYITKEQNALDQHWTFSRSIFMNPPYSEISKWMQKAHDTTSKYSNTTVVCLIPARTDTKWWHDYCSKGKVVLLKGRLKFSNSKNSAPFPSCIVIFNKFLDGRIVNEEDFFVGILKK